MAQTVIGFFNNITEAEKAVSQLVSSGISRDRIDLSRGGAGTTNENSGSEGAGVNPVSGSTRDENSVRRTGNDRTVDEEGRNTNVFTDFFNNLFGGSHHHDADRYSHVALSSNAVVTVHARSGEEAEAAADILDTCGAVDVDERARETGFMAYGPNADFTEPTATTGEDRSIPIIREDLEVGKREVERGSVRVRSRIVERPVEEHLRLREEHVRVERNPVDRPVSVSDGSAFQVDEIELTERAEVPVVNKEARVVEEVRLSKEVTEHDETIRDTVRSTDVDIDQTGESDRNRNDTTHNSGERDII